MAITQAMLDAERERIRGGCEHEKCPPDVCKGWRSRQAGFDRAIAFMREHGAPFYGGEVDFTGDYAEPFVRVEIPAR